MAVMDHPEAEAHPRSSIEKAPIIDPEDDTPSAFESLPDEIITQYALVHLSYGGNGLFGFGER
jgi:hypothetical protein